MTKPGETKENEIDDLENSYFHEDDIEGHEPESEDKEKEKESSNLTGFSKHAQNKLNIEITRKRKRRKKMEVLQNKMTEAQAEARGYQLGISYEGNLHLLTTNRAVVGMLLSNITSSIFLARNNIQIKMDRQIFHMRLIVYQIMLASMPALPLIISRLIISVEMICFFTSAYQAVSYLYPRNWIMFVEKMNFSAALMMLLMFVFYIGITEDVDPIKLKYVNSQLQMTGVYIIWYSLVTQVLILVVYSLHRVVYE